MSDPDVKVSGPASKNGRIAGVDAARLEAISARETARFLAARPRTASALKGAEGFWLDGVPMHWMKDWSTPLPLVVDRAKCARIKDIDGYGIDDFCLGDTGSMFGHAPKPVAKAIRRQAERGLTYMLPSRDALKAGRLLSEVFGDFRWQIATTATDANRNALKVARAVTGRPKVLVFHGCYHGTLDDTMVELQEGRTAARQGLVGQVQDLTLGAVAVEFNDIAAVEAALAQGDVAAVLTEPVMTNSCMVLPAEGFHEALRAACSRHGALLIIDETHTISSGLGGYTRRHGLKPDLFVVGKCVAGGMPTAVWGLSPEVAARFQSYDAARAPGHSGMGTTLSGNPMQFACLRATLSKVMTPENYARMEALAETLAEGLGEVIARHAAPWHVVRVGARVEFICAPGPLRNGTDAAAAHQPDLEAVIHRMLLNRGCLIAPFHNMMLISPVTTRRQVARLISAFDEVLSQLFA